MLGRGGDLGDASRGKWGVQWSQEGEEGACWWSRVGRCCSRVLLSQRVGSGPLSRVRAQRSAGGPVKQHFHAGHRKDKAGKQSAGKRGLMKDHSQHSWDYMPPPAKEPPEVRREAWDRPCPGAFRRSRILPTHWSGTSNLQSNETINCCCLSDSVVLCSDSSYKLYELILIFPPPLWDAYCYCPYFTDEETGTQQLREK